MNVLDYIVFGVFLLSVLFCTWKGLLMSLFNLGSLVVSFLLAQAFYPRVADLLNQTVLREIFENATRGWLNLGDVAADAELTHVVEELTIPQGMRDSIISNVGDFTGGVGDAVAGFIAGMAINALAILGVFILVFILMRLIAIVLRIVSKMPVLRTFNRLGGAILGLVMGGILSWLVLFVLNGLFSANPTFPVAELLEDSLIARLIY
ncbi:MAG: CvpA family protein [Defluviitaleaceae bacterium]|nr:CvpA family protein [Defluviitaleaceae bacterium]